MGVKQAFRKSNHDPYPGLIKCDLPDDREPEAGLLLTNMKDAQNIYQSLISDPRIKLLHIAPTPPKVLVSFAEDTLDSNGNPTRDISRLNLERRRRVSLFTDDHSFQRTDISFKDAIKSSRRREWSTDSKCLFSGEQEIIENVGKDIPEITRLNPDLLRVSSICITSRASYDLGLDIQGNILVVEVANDACVFSTPSADRITGYRKEVEVEIKEILLRDRDLKNNHELHLLLDEGIEKLTRIMNSAAISGMTANADISKVCHANLASARTYEDETRIWEMSGIEWSLMQGMRAHDFMNPDRRRTLVRLAEVIPPAKLLSPESASSALKDYFPADSRYPAFYPS